MAKNPNPRHYAKHIIIRSNGHEYPTLEGGTFTYPGMQREDVTGAKVYGFTRTAVAAQVSCSVPANFFTDFQDINDQEDVTIEVEIDTGQIYVMRNAWCVNPIAISGGNFTLEYHATSIERIK